MTGLKNKGRLFCLLLRFIFQYMCFEYRFLFRYFGLSIARDLEGQHFLDFSSLAAGRSSPGVLSSPCGHRPHWMDSVLGLAPWDLGISEVYSSGRHSPLRSSAPCPCLSTEKTRHRDCLKFYFKRLL